MINQIIFKIRRSIFNLRDNLPVIGIFFVISWNFLDDLKFIIQKNSMRFRASLAPGDNQLRKELAVFFKKRKAYQFIDRPEFQGILFQREGESRFAIIKKNILVSSGKILDIGASLGYFCHKFEDEGFDCYAMEADRMLCYFMEKLKKAEGKNFKIIPQSIFDYKRNQELIFDVILALSVFHNFLANKESYLDLIRLLGRLKAKELFFETYVPNPASPSGYYKDLTPEQFVDFIIENSIFKKVELLGKSENGRPIYKLTP